MNAAALERALDLGAEGTDWNAFMHFLYRDDFEKCEAAGPDKATCVLPVAHLGSHEGNGSDTFGPKYRCWRLEDLASSTDRSCRDCGTELPLTGKPGRQHVRCADCRGVS